MEATSESQADSGDWLAGAVIEFGDDIGPEPVDVRLEGLEFGVEEEAVT
jgi:hypothetical protein